MTAIIQHLKEELEAIISALDQGEETRAHWLARKAIEHIREQPATPDLLPVLTRLHLAASRRENIMGDPCSLLAAKAELEAANKEAIVAIAQATQPHP